MPTSTELSQQLLDKIHKSYSEAESKILANLAKKVNRAVEGEADFRLKDVQELRKEVEGIIDRTNTEVKGDYGQGIERMYGKARDSVSKDLRATLDELKDVVPAQVTRLILETDRMVDNASVRILRDTDDIYRSVLSDVSSGLLIGVETKRQVAQQALNRFADKGITGFVDKLGRKWDIASYTDMAVRTVASKVALQGHIDRQQELDEDLMIVSSFGNTCPLCSPWEGRVLSISGKDPKHPSLAEAEASGLFHPNCKHTLLSYFEGITEIVKEEYEPEVYDAQQKQRYHERQIRHWKRREAVALDDTEKVRATRKVRDWQGVQRNHVAEYNLKRKYGREGSLVGVATPKPPEPVVEPKPVERVPKMMDEYVPPARTTVWDETPSTPSYASILSDRATNWDFKADELKQVDDYVRSRVDPDTLKILNYGASTLNGINTNYRALNEKGELISEHYSPSIKHINMRLAEDFTKYRVYGILPTTTFHHELGHHIDSMNGDVSRGKNFTNALRVDYNNFLAGIQEKSGGLPDMVRHEATLVLHDMGAKGSGISDSFGILTKNQVVGRHRHDDDYADDFIQKMGMSREQVATLELFADMVSSEISPEKRAYLQRYVPETYKQYEKFKKDLIEGMKSE